MRAFAEINLDAIGYNAREVKKYLAPATKMLCVIKADAYGHGAVPVAKELLECGADCFGVACVEEAKEIRRAGITLPILLLGFVDPQEATTLLEYDIMPTVFDYETAEWFSKIAQQHHKKMRIHVKIDSGMSRIGFVYHSYSMIHAITEEVLRLAALPGLEIEGIFTHLSTADEEDQSYALQQFERFMEVCDSLQKKGLHIPNRHICNSAATVLYPQMHLDMVRPGIILYGCAPSPRVAGKGISLQPTMSLKSTVVMVKELPAHTFVGYGNTFQTTTNRKIATLSIGYADGLFRCLSNSGEVLVNGCRAKIVGRICMDQCMIDVTTVKNINKGDQVTLFGEGLSVDEQAALAGSISYELLCAVGKRVPRVYIKNHCVTEQIFYV